MKRILFITVVALLLSNCRKPDDRTGDFASFSLTATMGSFTSSDLPSGLQIKWPADAKLGLFEFDLKSQLFLNSNRPFTLSQGAGTVQATLLGIAQASDGWSSGEKIFYAYYPFDPQQTTASAVSFSIPYIQTQMAEDPLAHLAKGLFMTTTVSLPAGNATAATITLAPSNAVVQFEITNQTNGDLIIEELSMGVEGANMYRAGIYNFRSGEYTFRSNDRTSAYTLLLDEEIKLAVGGSTTLTLSILPVSIFRGGELILNIITNRGAVEITKMANPDEIHFEAGKLYVSPVTINETTFTGGSVINLPEGQNSFIVAPSETGEDLELRIPITRVNEFWGVDPTNSIGPSTSWVAEIIWQDFDLTGAGQVLTITPGRGSGTGPTTRIGLTLKNYPADQWGNAVVGIRRADDNGNAVGAYLWSWHIWISDVTTDNAKPYPGHALGVMDRNLGAKNSTPGSPGALGLFYQYGRKDPFPGAAAVAPETTNRAATTLASWPTTTSTNGGTYAFAVQNPTTFVTGALNGDWLTVPQPNQAGIGWQPRAKVLHDPCPKGWRVSDVTSGGAAQTWLEINATNLIYDETNHGRTYNARDWFPLPGYLHPATGALTNVGQTMFMATGGGATNSGLSIWNPDVFATTPIQVVRDMQATPTTVSNNNNITPRATGFSVRCVRFPADD